VYRLDLTSEQGGYQQEEQGGYQREEHGGAQRKYTMVTQAVMNVMITIVTKLSCSNFESLGEVSPFLLFKFLGFSMKGFI